MKEKYKALVKHYGESEVKVNTITALNDLAELLLREMEKKNPSRKKVCKGIAAVKIQLEQLHRVYGIPVWEIQNKEIYMVNKELKRLKEQGGQENVL